MCTRLSFGRFLFDTIFSISSCSPFRLLRHQKKPAQRISVAGFTTRSPSPLVTTLGSRFIAST